MSEYRPIKVGCWYWSINEGSISNWSTYGNINIGNKQLYFEVFLGIHILGLLMLGIAIKLERSRLRPWDRKPIPTWYWDAELKLQQGNGRQFYRNLWKGVRKLWKRKKK